MNLKEMFPDKVEKTSRFYAVLVAVMAALLMTA